MSNLKEKFGKFELCNEQSHKVKGGYWRCTKVGQNGNVLLQETFAFTSDANRWEIDNKCKDCCKSH